MKTSGTASNTLLIYNTADQTRCHRWAFWFRGRMIGVNPLDIETLIEAKWFIVVWGAYCAFLLDMVFQ